MDKEKLAKQIQADYKKDGEPISFEDALEVAEMEIKAGATRHYEQSDKPKERKAPARKEDADKRWLIQTIRNCINIYTPQGIEQLAITNPEKYIDFVYKGKCYTVSLTAHRPQK